MKELYGPCDTVCIELDKSPEWEELLKDVESKILASFGMPDIYPNFPIESFK